MLCPHDKFTAELLTTLGHKIGRFILNAIDRERKGECTALQVVDRISNVLTDVEFRLSDIEFGKSHHTVIRDVLTIAIGMLYESVNPWYEGVNNDNEFVSILKEQDEE